ncbi:MAG TPA: helix-turn-helix domain-containing protein [Thermomicrobiales bacterium]|nr:helix-turn-helix domain-containing protein [Thermomicrobiales bacterium]
MIRNERQYRASRAHRHRLLATRAGYEAAPQADPLAQAALLGSVDALLGDVEAELAEYEALRAGALREVVAEGLGALPDLLVQARIADGLTQRQLAERLGVAEEAVQRDEAGGYAHAGLDRLARVAEALGIRLRLTGALGPNNAPVRPPADAAAS